MNVCEKPSNIPRSNVLGICLAITYYQFINVIIDMTPHNEKRRTTHKKWKSMKQTNPQVFTVDLARIEGNGDFPCPSCAASISPEDTTDSVYTIVDTQMNGEALEELTIQCNKCGCKIRLIGFV